MEFKNEVMGTFVGLRQDRIINLVGASGSGKTTLAKELEKKGFNIIQSYTNRKPRAENEWGHTFINDWYDVEVDGDIIGFDNMIAYFNDYDKDEHYFATYDQYQGKGTSIYIVDPGGAEQVKKNVSDAEVVTIFLSVDSVVKLQSLMNRGYNPNEHEFKEGESIDTYYNNVKNKATERMISDMEIFSKVKCDYTVDANRELEEVLEDVIRIIEND